ncbi:FHA domain-containing protein [Bradyrhizobium sp.]|uniref:FHA domain-containing protein n=1 Tax=Bradyrhizobium sp. TaxID=376 RepID=UPI0025BFD7D8|nr:FHA domain-containing protein [Bradyrhizobium sp.]
MRRLALAISVAAAVAPQACAADAPMVKAQDGILAELTIIGSEALMRWRFLRKPTRPIDQVTATYNGRPLGVPTVEPYPGAGQAVAAIALLDVSGPQREEQIERFKQAMLLLAARKPTHVQLGFAVYALEGHLLVPTGNDPRETLALLAAVPPLDEEANLSGALVSSIRTLAALEADRRAVFVLTDGHNDGAVALGDVATLAQSLGVSLYFLIAPGRSADLPALALLAESTAGQLVDDKGIATFLGDPFALLNSGAQVRFPLDGARKFMWDSESELRAVIHYGDGRLDIAASADIAAASTHDTAAYLWRAHAMSVVAAGGMIFALLGAALAGTRSRAVRLPQPIGSAAVLEDPEGGRHYPLTAPFLRIGRSPENDLVINEPTVGRWHAMVQQIGDLAFSITDQSSANGTLVNGHRIVSVVLSDGDVISIGSRSLRFKIPET